MKIEQGDGFIAALDQSGGSTPKALKGYGYRGRRMVERRGDVRPHPPDAHADHHLAEFGGGKVIGAILFERTMDGEVDGKPVPQALIEQGVVPFIKIDKGLEDEANGVQLMKPMPDLTRCSTAPRRSACSGPRSARSSTSPTSRASPPSSRSSSRSRSRSSPRPGADHRARGEHQEPGAGWGRPHPARRDPQGPRRIPKASR